MLAPLGSDMNRSFAGYALSLLGMLLACSGCGVLRLPAIDPTGEGLFLPAPNYTTIGQPRTRIRDLEPLFPRTPAVPVCAEPPAPAPPRGGCFDHRRNRTLMRLGDPGRLVVTPGRLVAPVGSEIIVRTGLCGPDGFFLTQQPVEWTLSQDSVGNLVGVGGDGRYVFGRILRDESNKLSSNYARTRTSRNNELLNRGNLDPRDDVLLRKGEGWVSVTSPIEGASYVTALAPDAESWDHRRQTVEIQWVDATPSFPTPVSIPAGQVHELKTTVRRASDGSPVEGWIVLYELLDGPPAQFENGRQTIEAVTNGLGEAVATVTPASQDPGTSNVRILLIRPPMGRSPRFPISQGFTSVVWSAAGLSLRAAGPESATTGAPVAYQIEVANPGDQPVRDVRVSATTPPNLRVAASSPPARSLDNRLTWELGALQGGERRTLTLNAEFVRGGDVRLQFDAESLGGLRASDTVATRVQVPALRLELQSPAAARVNDPIPTRIVVSNPSSERLEGLRLTAEFGGGLRHRDGYESPLENDRLGDLAPGETRTLPLTFIAREPGRQCYTVTVRAAGATAATEQACIEVAPAGDPPDGGAVPVEPAPTPAALTVTKRGPARMELGQQQQFVITVVNTGSEPLTNVLVSDRYDRFLVPEWTDKAHAVVEGEVRWSIPRLDPQRRAEIRVVCRAKEPVAGAFPADRVSIFAVNEVVVASDQGVRGRDQVRTEIVRPGAIPVQPAPAAPNAAPPGAGAAVAGPDRVSINSEANPARVGQSFSILIVVANPTARDESNVRLRVVLPRGLRFEGARGPTALRSGGSVVDFAPARQLRAGEALRAFPYRIDVTAIEPGRMPVRAEITSDTQTQPATAATTIQVER